MAKNAVEVEGLDDFRKRLKELPPRLVTLNSFGGETTVVSDINLNNELSRMFRGIVQEVATSASARAKSMGGQQAHFASAIKGRASASSARIEVAGPRTPKGKSRANPAFWGTKAQGNWIGTSWDAGSATGGPYAINATIAAEADDIVRRFGEAMEEIAKDAFPD